MRIPLAKTDTGIEELEAITRVMQSGRLASGPEIDAFEAEFANYLGVKFAVMTNSGTSALVAILRACGIGPGDEVILPSLTFVATVNAVLQCGAIPVLTDVNNSALIEPNKVQPAISDRTRAIIPVDLYGQRADLASIRRLINKANTDRGNVARIWIIEDAAEALGARSLDDKAGSLDNLTGADASIFGFYPNKVLTTGEGGMVVTSDPATEQRCRGLINQGRTGGSYDSATIPGFSARGMELSAAMGRSQLRSLDNRLNAREEIALNYTRELQSRGLHPLIQPSSLVNSKSAISWFTMPVLLPSNVDRNQVMSNLASKGIESADYFPAIHLLEAFAPLVKTSGDLITSRDLGRRMLCLPFWPGIMPWIEEIADAAAQSTSA